MLLIEELFNARIRIIVDDGTPPIPAGMEFIGRVEWHWPNGRRAWSSGRRSSLRCLRIVVDDALVPGLDGLVVLLRRQDQGARLELLCHLVAIGVELEAYNRKDGVRGFGTGTAKVARWDDKVSPA